MYKKHQEQFSLFSNRLTSKGTDRQIDNKQVIHFTANAQAKNQTRPRPFITSTTNAKHVPVCYAHFCNFGFGQHSYARCPVAVIAW